MKKFLPAFLTLLLFQTYECSISSEKCKEYAKAVYVQGESPTLSLRAAKTNVSECGIASVPLIVGGSKAALKEFPHMVVIGFGLSAQSDLSWDCGGSLISDLYVLTAAHCLKSRQVGPSQKVRLGTLHLDKLDSDYQERRIVERTGHPQYKKSSKANDIALLKMESPVEFTPSVRPACLFDTEFSPGKQAFATGFGKLSYDATSGTTDLMKVTLDIYSNDLCDKSLSLKEPVGDTMICAGKLAGGKDTCQGDSGGPLQTVLEQPYCMYGILGVTSFGKFCGFENSPAIYTKVSKFIPWIESIVWSRQN